MSITIIANCIYPGLAGPATISACTNTGGASNNSKVQSIYARIANTIPTTVVSNGNPAIDTPTATAPPVDCAPVAEPDREAVGLPFELPDALEPVGVAEAPELVGTTVAAAAKRSVEA